MLLPLQHIVGVRPVIARCWTTCSTAAELVDLRPSPKYLPYSPLTQLPLILSVGAPDTLAAFVATDIYIRHWLSCSGYVYATKPVSLSVNRSRYRAMLPRPIEVLSVAVARRPEPVAIV